MTARQASQVCDNAAEALAGWSALGPNARRSLLSRAADALEAKIEAVVAAMMAEICATEAWARFNHKLAVSMIRESAALTTQIGGEIIPSDKPGCLAMAVREPAGVVLGIAPWNAPLIPWGARHRNAACLWQYGGPEGLGAMPPYAQSDRRGV